MNHDKSKCPSNCFSEVASTIEQPVGISSTVGKVPFNSVNSSEPARETEINKELGRLFSIAANLENIKDRFFARLEGVLNGGGLKNTDTPKTPENSSRLGQELNTVNYRLNEVANGLDELLNRLEL